MSIADLRGSLVFCGRFFLLDLRPVGAYMSPMGKPTGLTAKGISMRVAMLYAQIFEDVLKSDGVMRSLKGMRQILGYKGHGKAGRLLLCDIAAIATVDYFKKEWISFPDNEHCHNWKTLADNLSRGRFRVPDPIGTLAQVDALLDNP